MVFNAYYQNRVPKLVPATKQYRNIIDLKMMGENTREGG